MNLGLINGKVIYVMIACVEVNYPVYIADTCCMKLLLSDTSKFEYEYQNECYSLTN